MMKKSKEPVDFEVLTLSRQQQARVRGGKVVGTRSQYRLNIPSKFIDACGWTPQQKVVISTTGDGSLLLSPLKLQSSKHAENP